MQVRAGYDDDYSLPAERSRSSTPWAVSEPRAPVRHSVPVKTGGVFLGIAVAHELGVEFVATHATVRTMDQNVWPTAAYAQNAAQQLFKAGPCPSTDRVVGKPAQPWRWCRRIWNNVQRLPPEANNYMPANKGVER